MKTPAPIQIFKPGKHTAMSGAVLEFSESDLQAMVEAYDPAVYDAPLVIGHPKLNAPAYGWVGSLSFADDGTVLAEPRDVDPEFAELVRQKKYKKVSASFFSPNSPSNPKPGVYYLRHVGFLGAHPPAVKGLKEVNFAETEDGSVEFGFGDFYIAGLFRRLREWMIGTHGQETADTVLPNWEIESLKEHAIRDEVEDRVEAAAGPGPEFSDHTKGDEMSEEERARLAALEAENTRLKKEKADFVEAENKRRAAAAHAENESFAEGLIKEGRLLPANKAVAVATLDMLAQRDEPYEFGEGDDKVAVSLDSFKTLLQSFPKVVDFSEHAAGEDDEDVSFAAPQGFTVSVSALEIHAKAVAYQKANPNVSYLDAVKAVS